MTSLKEGLARGYFGVNYSLLEYSHQPVLHPELADWLRLDGPKHTGWIPFVWLDNEPHTPELVDEHTYRSTIITENLTHPHYERWSASTLGYFTLIRAHDLDHNPQYKEYDVIELTTPVWRVAEFMLHAERMAKRFGAKEIEFTVQFTGLKGRRLLSLPESNRLLSREYKTGAPEYKKAITLDATTVDAGVAAFTDQLMEPFYRLFEFTLPAELCEQEINKMRSNRF